MKINIITILIFFSASLLAEEALFDPSTGYLIIPKVSLPDSSSYWVWMERVPDENDMLFKLRGVADPDPITSTDTAQFYESSISGSWSGWDGNTTITLTNGETWQQATYHYEYDYAYNPSVIVYQSGANWKMWVEGMEEPVTVTKLQ